MSILSSPRPDMPRSDVSVHALLKASYIFGDEHEQLLHANLCILEGASALYCTSGAQRYLSELHVMRETGAGRKRSSASSSAGGRIFANFRDLFLPSHFDAPIWTVVTMEDEEAVFAPIHIFRWLFPSLLGVLILSSLLLVSVETRRRFKPLDVLRSGALRLGGGDFNTRIEVTSGDEFEDLADSFNRMAAKLGNQFGFLTTMSNIDRILLSRPNRFKVAETVVRQVPESLGVNLFAVLVLESGHEDQARLFTYESESSRGVATQWVHVDEAFKADLAADDRHSLVVERSRAEGLQAFFPKGVDALRIYPLTDDRQQFGALLLNRARGRLLR
ncbi:MAG: HAMP domain-containing protein [Halioglobus sp.]|nr:HAMP domain-containing protein [Halioglobus sp.]